MRATVTLIVSMLMLAGGRIGGAELPQAVPQRPLKAGLPGLEAAAWMSVPEGFHVSLVAAEPQVHQPVALALDHRGRLWVAEAYTYPRRAPEGEGKDKIIILEDRDHDGQFETRKTFIEGLNLVSGLEVGFGGVWVGAAPYLMFIPDQDGDDQPDSAPQILLDGFGYQDTHETLNSFNWGPDGWLYGCHGVFTHSRVGKPGTPDDQRTPLNAAVWRYHPIRHHFEVFAWGTSNPWGVDFNDYGHPFITACVIPHLWHVIQGARYHRQGGQHFNPYVFDDIKTIAVHRHYAGNIRDHAWWGHEPEPPADTLAAGGGHAHCGAMVYLGDNWPEEYRNQIFMHNIHGNRINNDRLQRHASGYIGTRAPDVLLANDKWFRGISLKYGPDGSVYLIDWYDPNACHRTNPEIWDRTNGRVYNLRYGDRKPVAVDLASLSDQELVQLQLHRNDWYVRIARRLLQHRAARGQLDRSAVTADLLHLLHQHPDVTRQLRALWALHGIGELPDSLLKELLGHESEYVRSWAIQLQLEDGQADAAFQQRLVQLAEQDPSPLVRLYLASALQRLPLEQRWAIAQNLVQHPGDAEDHNLPLMYWYGIEPLVPAEPTRAIALAQNSAIPTVTQFILRRAASEGPSREALVQALAKVEDDQLQTTILQQMLHALQGQVDVPMPGSWAAAYERLLQEASPEVGRLADQVAVLFGDRRVLPRMRHLLADRSAPLPRRQEALQILVRSQDRQSAAALQQILDESALRGPALRALAALDDPQTPAAILARYEQLSDEERRDAIGTLTSRPSYALALLQAMRQGQVPRSDLHAYNVRQLLRFENEVLTEQLKEVWGEIRDTSEAKQEQIARYKEQFSAEQLKQADLSNGRRIFDKTCASCHRLFGQGGEVGPDITGSNRANLDYILENVVDPSAVVGKDYRMTILELADGRVVSGLVQQETDSAVTIRTLNDTQVVPKREIDERQLSPLSMMPEGLLDSLAAEDAVDLIAYLASPSQVPLRGEPAPLDPETGRVPHALEAERMKVIGKTGGTVQSQVMSGFPADRWSGAQQLWWTGARPEARLDLELPVEQDGVYQLQVVLTRAPDYGMVRLWLNDQPLSKSIDLFSRQVVTTGVLRWNDLQLTAGEHTLSLEILGANPQAVPAYMVGLDYVRLESGTSSSN